MPRIPKESIMKPRHCVACLCVSLVCLFSMTVAFADVELPSILGDSMVSGIKYEKEGDLKQLDVKGVIIEIGRIPKTEPFKGVVDFDDDGHIKIDCQGHTSVPGIFAAGDCASGHEYQYIISAGQGCMALIKAARYLATRKEK